MRHQIVQPRPPGGNSSNSGHDGKIRLSSPTRKTQKAGNCRNHGQVYRLEPLTGGPHFAKRFCFACGRFCGFEPWPITISEAYEHKLQFGKYKGESLGIVVETDRSYAEWIARKFRHRDGYRKLVRMLGLLLEQGREVQHG